MAVNVTLTINTEQAKAALKGVNDAITQIKINGSNVTIGGKVISQQMHDIGNAAEQSGEQIEKTNQKVTNNIIGQVRVLTQGIDKSFTNLAKNFFSWWSIIIAAVQLATKTFTYFFENLTQNIQKMTTRGNTAIKMAKRLQQESQKKVKTSKDLIGQLQKLNQLQSLNIDQQRFAQNVIRTQRI